LFCDFEPQDTQKDLWGIKISHSKTKSFAVPQSTLPTGLGFFRSRNFALAKSKGFYLHVGHMELTFDLDIPEPVVDFMGVAFIVGTLGAPPRGPPGGKKPFFWRGGVFFFVVKKASGRASAIQWGHWNDGWDLTTIHRCCDYLLLTLC